MEDNDSVKYFDKTDVKAIKGGAILLMLLHHVWAFPSRVPVDYPIIKPNIPITFNNREFFLAIGIFGKLCVSIYMFLGGYAFYRQFSNERKNVLIKRLKNLYINYWKIFLIFIPIAFLFFSNQTPYAQESLHNKYERFDVITFILNFTGISCSYNPEWWFLFGYVRALFFGQIYVFWLKYKRDKNIYAEILEIIFMLVIFCITIPEALTRYGFNDLKEKFLFKTFFIWQYYIIAFLVGILVSRYDLAAKILRFFRNNFHKITQACISLIGLFTIFYLRCFSVDLELDLLYAVLFSVFLLLFLKSITPLYNVFVFLGKHSTNIWYIHSFYSYYFYSVVKIVFSTQNAIIDFGILLCLSLLSSICLDKFYKYIENGAKILYSKIKVV